MLDLFICRHQAKALPKKKKSGKLRLIEDDEPSPRQSLAMHFKQLIENQRQFFRTGVTVPTEFRRLQLLQLLELTKTNRDAYVKAIHADLRRPLPFCEMEIDSVVAELQLFLDNFEYWSQTEEKGDEPFGSVGIQRMPLGVCLIISPFNFPIGLALRPIAAALAAGNTVVLKPSEHSENASHILYSTLSGAFDPEVLTVVEGDAEVSQALLAERYDHIFYTGSPGIGKIIMSAAARNLTSVTLELGGKCPVVVLEDADIAKTAESVVQAKFFNCGQVCLTVDYVLVAESIKDKFLEAVKTTIKKTFGEKPKSSPMYSRLINKNHWNRVKSYIAKTKGKLVYKAADDDDHDDCYVGPHVYEVEANDPLMDEEMFGPILLVLPLPTPALDAAIEFINGGEKPLAAYIYTQDVLAIDRFFAHTHCGNSVSNGITLNYHSIKIPFGGVGQSGMGRYHGKFGFDTFTHEKAVVRAKV